MTTLNLLKVYFDIPLRSWELPAFRFAMRQSLQLVTSADERYPLIQFKTRHQQGRQQPMLVVIGEKIKELKKEWLADSPIINLQDSKHTISVTDWKLLPFPLRTDKGFHTYNLFNYHPFNQDNYKHYRNLVTKEEKNNFLQQLLVQHLDAFMLGVGWQPDPPIQVKGVQLLKPKLIPYQNYQAQCYDLRFHSNLWMPEHIGLGKGVSLGFGVLRLPKKKNVTT